MLTSAQWRAFYRASHAPNRIVVGQVGINHDSAKRLVDEGLWECGEFEMCKGKPVMRYRFSDAGMAVLEHRTVSAQKQPTPTETNVNESATNGGQ